MGVEELKAKIVKVKEAGKIASVNDRPVLVKELESLETELAKAQSKPKGKAKAQSKPKGKAKAQSQGIKDFAIEFVKAKGSGLTLQGKTSRRIKGLASALFTRKWTQDKVDPLTFEVKKKERKFVVQMQADGSKATLTTDNKVVSFPLGKGAFKSVDYVLAAYGHRYMSAKQVYEETESVV